MFIASYPASFLPERGHGFHVRFPDPPEALTGGDDLEDTRLQAADCLAEAIAGRITRANEIPPPSKAKRGKHLISVPLYLAPKLALYLTMRERRITGHRSRKIPIIHRYNNFRPQPFQRPLTRRVPCYQDVLTRQNPIPASRLPHTIRPSQCSLTIRT